MNKHIISILWLCAFALNSHAAHLAPEETNSTWGELTATTVKVVKKTTDLTQAYLYPDAPEPEYPSIVDLRKSCEALYYELTALDQFSTESGAQILQDPYAFLTDPVNRAALLGSSYFSFLYLIVPANGVLSDYRRRITLSLAQRKEAIRVMLARKQCFQ